MILGSGDAAACIKFLGSVALGPHNLRRKAQTAERDHQSDAKFRWPRDTRQSPTLCACVFVVALPEAASLTARPLPQIMSHIGRTAPTTARNFNYLALLPLYIATVLAQGGCVRRGSSTSFSGYFTHGRRSRWPVSTNTLLVITARYSGE